MKRLKTALLGLRGVGVDYFDALLGDDQFDLVAVADKDARALPDRLSGHRSASAHQQAGSGAPSVRRYTDYRSLVVETASAGLDLLVVALEPHESVAFVTLAASQGINVFHRAPFARDTNEGQEIVRLFADHKTRVAVARPWAFDPAVTPLASLDKHVGQVYAATAFVTVEKPILSVARVRRPTHGEVLHVGGGDLLNQAYEVIDLLVHWLGTPESVYAQCAARERSRDTREAVAMTLRFANDRIGSVVVLAGSSGPSWNVTVAGAKATTTMSPSAISSSPDETEDRSKQTRKIESVARALSAFGGELLSGVAARVGQIEEHLATLATIESACLSASTGAPESPGRLLR